MTLGKLTAGLRRPHSLANHGAQLLAGSQQFAPALISGYGQRSLLGRLIAQLAFRYFVDSVNGNDANSGRGVTNAWRSFDPVNALSTAVLRGAGIGIAKGSLLYSMLDLSADGISVGVYGYGAAPIIDCSDAIPAMVNVGGASPLVWQGTITLPNDTKALGNIYANGVPLVQVTSLALCQATAGSAYIVDWTAASTTLYIHTATGVAPGADGLEYRYSRRLYAIHLSGNECSVMGAITTRRNAHQDGSVSLTGSRLYLSQAAANDGCRHNMLLGANAVVEDCTFTDGTNYEVGSTAANGLVLHTSAGAGSSAATRNLTFTAGANSPNFIGSIAHTDNVADPWDSIVHEAPRFIGPVTVTASENARISALRDAYYEGVVGGMAIGQATVAGELPRGTGTINNLVAFQAAGSCVSSNNVLRVPRLTLGFYYSSVAAAINLTINNDVITVTDGKDGVGGVVADFMSIMQGTVSGAFDLSPALAAPITTAIRTAAAGFVDGMDGVSWPIGLPFVVNGVTYTSLAAYKTATGKQPTSTVKPLPTPTASDDFNRADENLEVTWTRNGGAAAQAAVRSNQLAMIGGTRTLYTKGGALASADHWASCTVKGAPAASGPFGLIVRATDVDNCLALRWNSTIVQVYKIVAGVITLLGSLSVTVSVGDVMVLAARGAKLFAYWAPGGDLNSARYVFSSSAWVALTDSAVLSGTLAGAMPFSSVVNPYLDDWKAAPL